MSKSEYVTDYKKFEQLWRCAQKAKQRVADAVRSDSAVYFDSSDICTLHYYQFLRALLARRDCSEFAVVVLRPEPVDYFHHHFGKYPAIVLGPEHSERDFVASLNADPGNSPADAIDNNSERYAVFPLEGDWAIYADRAQELAAMAGPPDVIEFTRQHYPFNVFEHNPGFSIDD